ncbi:unnamed protein product [Candida verbasci]|uniref:Histone-binding protein RBBP4-like N-terminal domain-containing protein n=1 Tax=Candida verbasci TaxID=1227364 RepID=A0A9W4XNC9_9ASCO|nr:unnamed protein product [Candida verbasci]
MPVSTTAFTTSTNEFAKAEQQIIQEQQLQSKIINEEYKIWKKTVPLLYDLIHTFAFDSSSLIFEWVKDYKKINSDYIQCQYLIGTNTSIKTDNYLKLGSINLPKSLISQTSDIPIPSSVDTSDFQILKQWKTQSEINALKINGDVAISFNSNGLIQSYNLINNDIVDYKYHKQEGYALNWFNSSSFLSGSLDSQIAYWDISKPSTPIQLFKSHSGAVNDISSLEFRKLIGSVSDDSTTQFHDLRTSENPIISIENKHIQNCISFHPSVDTLYVTGGKDNIVNLYDIRNYKIPFRKFYGHNDSISQLKWDPNSPNLLYSSGIDKRILQWDLESLDEEFTYPDESESGKKNKKSDKIDPCLKFIHGGHLNRINSFDIHPKIKNLIGSVGDDKLMEIWKIKTIPEEEEEEEKEEEEKEEEKEAEEKEEEEKEEETNEEKENKEEPKEDEEIKEEEESKEEPTEPTESKEGDGDVEMKE